MKRLIQLAVWLYPPRWRRRYAREFEALLDDVDPGGRELFDVLKGALTMQIRTLGTIPAIFALMGMGAMVGGIVAMQTSPIYSSSALILIQGTDIDASASFLISQMVNVVGTSKEERAATSINVKDGKSNSGLPLEYVRLSYRNPDAIQAQRVTAKFVAALAANSPTSWSPVVIDSPSVPKRPINRNYIETIAAGSIVGLIIGGITVFVFRLRRRRAGAN